MKALNKTLILVLSLTLLLCLIQCTAFADSSVLTIGTVNGVQAGETVSIDVSVSENLNAILMQFAISYDTDVLELTSVQNGSLFAGLDAPTVNSQVAGHVYFCWDSITDTISHAGSILTLNFTAKAGSSGATTISIDNSEELIFCDKDYKDVTPQIVSGGVVFGGNAITSINVTLGNSTVAVGGTVQATAKVLPENASDKTVTWSIPDGGEFAEIDSASGVITGLSAGSATVRATACDGSGLYGEATISVSSIVDSGEGGTGITWTLDDAGTLTFTGEGKINGYGFGSSPWSKYSSQIKALIINDGITYVPVYAFPNCNNLKSVTFTDSMREIGYGAFLNDRVSTVNFIGDINKWALIKFGEGYANPGPPKVNGVSPTMITVPDGVTSISQEAFCGWKELETVVLPDSVKYIEKCAFSSCGSLKTLNLPEGLTTLGDFSIQFCDSLTEITLPDSLTTIGHFALRGCNGLTTIQIPKNVSSIGEGVFESCTNLNGVNVVSDNPYFSSTDGVLFNKSGTELVAFTKNKATEYSVPGTVKSIKEHAFDSCKALVSIKIPASMETISPFAFYYCTGITQVKISKGVSNIGHDAFHGCSSIADVYFSGSEDEWNAITKGYNNAPLANANLTYNYSDSQEPDNITDFTVSVPTAMSENVSITAPSGGWVIGDNTFSASADKACVLAVSYDGGQTYTRLTATANGDGTYNFNVNITDTNTIIACAYKGDANGDNNLSSGDINKLKAAMLKKTTLSPLAVLSADVNGDNDYTSGDINKLKAAMLEKTTINW